MCKYCGSKNLHIEDLDDDEAIYYRVQCLDCGAKWKEDGPDAQVKE